MDRNQEKTRISMFSLIGFVNHLKLLFEILHEPSYIIFSFNVA